MPYLWEGHLQWLPCKYGVWICASRTFAGIENGTPAYCGACKGCRWVVEQPSGSILESHPRFQRALEIIKVSWYSHIWLICFLRAYLKNSPNRGDSSLFCYILTGNLGLHLYLLDGCLPGGHTQKASALEQWFQPGPSNCWCWWMHEQVRGGMLAYQIDWSKVSPSAAIYLHRWKQLGNIYASIVVSHMLSNSDHPSPAKIAKWIWRPTQQHLPIWWRAIYGPAQLSLDWLYVFDWLAFNIAVMFLWGNTL